MKEINWGIIGLGNVALKFAEGFKFSNISKLKGIASKDQEKLKQFQNTFQVEKEYCFNEYEELLKSNEIDIIYIALPNSLHHEWIIKCIKNNKKILVEKPSTLNFSEIKDIKENFDVNNIFFAEGFMYRFHPQIYKIIEILNKKIIGELISMKTYFGNNILSKKFFFGFKKKKKIDPTNRLYSKKLGGGAILDLGCYPISLSVFIASLISEVKFNEFQILEKKKELGVTGVDIDSYAKIVFKNGFVSYIGASFVKNLENKTEITGENGKLIIDNVWSGMPGKIKIIKKDNIEEISIKDSKNIYSYEINSLSKNILENKKKPDFPGVTFEDSLINMAIIDEWLK